MQAKTTRAIVCSILFILAMLSLVIASAWLKPVQRWADHRPVPFSDAVVPSQFGDWHQVVKQQVMYVNPELKGTVDALYSDVVTRTYVNSSGQQVMLSIAYGQDQRDALQLHYPDVCYPAQGFAIKSRRSDVLVADGHKVRLRQLVTENREGRQESLSYWSIVGNRVESGRIDKKLSQLELALRGYVADGLIFRVSSIERHDGVAQFELHKRFLTAFAADIPVGVRDLLLGKE